MNATNTNDHTRTFFTEVTEGKTSAKDIYDYARTRLEGSATMRNPEQIPFANSDSESTPINTPVTLSPLETFIRTQTLDWLTKLVYPIRAGTHNQTAFAFGLMLDWADATVDAEFRAALAAKALAFHAGDTNCPLAYEPSGEDFLSPCLMEADLMRRVLPQAEYAAWLSAFLPQIPLDGSGDWLTPGMVLDPTDGKLVHLDGVNLSRAWALEGIAAALPPGGARAPALLAPASVHKQTGITAVSEAHYAGSHWLASFATYLETRRGIAPQ